MYYGTKIEARVSVPTRRVAAKDVTDWLLDGWILSFDRKRLIKLYAEEYDRNEPIHTFAKNAFRRLTTGEEKLIDEFRESNKWKSPPEGYIAEYRTRTGIHLLVRLREYNFLEALARSHSAVLSMQERQTLLAEHRASVRHAELQRERAGAPAYCGRHDPYAAIDPNHESEASMTYTKEWK